MVGGTGFEPYYTATRTAKRDQKLLLNQCSQRLPVFRFKPDTTSSSLIYGTFTAQ